MLTRDGEQSPGPWPSIQRGITWPTRGEPGLLAHMARSRNLRRKQHPPATLVIRRHHLHPATLVIRRHHLHPATQTAGTLSSQILAVSPPSRTSAGN
jgi:hypothetical protein